MPFVKDEAEIGALWLKSGPKGEYMTGNVGGVQVVCFKSKSSSPKAPAWNVLKARPRGSATSSPRQW